MKNIILKSILTKKLKKMKKIYLKNSKLTGMPVNSSMSILKLKKFLKSGFKKIYKF